MSSKWFACSDKKVLHEETENFEETHFKAEIKEGDKEYTKNTQPSGLLKNRWGKMIFKILI